MSRNYDGSKAPKVNRSRRSDVEHEMQVAQIEWTEWQGQLWPELLSIFAVPNQGKRSISGYGHMKAEGLKTGQWDLCLPVARHGFGSLFVENKTLDLKKSKLSSEQINRGKILEAAGNLCYVIREFEHFKNLVTWYLRPYEDWVQFERGELWEYREVSL